MARTSKSRRRAETPEAQAARLAAPVTTAPGLGGVDVGGGAIVTGSGRSGGGAGYAGTASASSFMDGHDGGPRLSWATYRGGGWNPMSPVQTVFGTIPPRETSVAASVASDLAANNPTLAAIVESIVASGVGTGLTVSSKPDAAALGISPDDAADLATSIEKAFAEWAGNPDHCDWTGRHDFHALAATAFRSAILTGEIAGIVGWRRAGNSAWGTKLNLLAAGQIDMLTTRLVDGLHVVHGVAFDDAGILVGYFVRPAPLGNPFVIPMPKFMPARTPWGRPVVVHIFEALDGRQIRGISPLVAALTPAHDRSFLGERVLTAASIQSSFALTIESDDRPEVLAAGLGTDNDLSGMEKWARERRDWYDSAKVDVAPGKVNFLARGDKLKMNQPGTPNSTFDDFDKSLVRQAARAAGVTYEDASGDYSQTNFAASRMANFVPSLLTARRRKLYVEGFYRAAFEAVIEEAFARRMVEVPAGAPPFWAAKEAYLKAAFLGSPPPEPDRLKAANALETELSNGLITLTEALAQRGVDADQHFEQLKSEADMLASLGFTHPLVMAGEKAKVKGATAPKNGETSR